MKVTINNLDHQGRGIGKIDNKIIFIPNTLVDEVVDVDILKQKSKFLEGKVIDYIKQSEHRINPICPYFNNCGGCDLLHLKYEKQCEFKEDKVKNIINKYTRLDNVVRTIIPSENIYYYRNKVTFQVYKKVGFYKEKSYVVVPIEKCYITNEKINNIIPYLNKLDLSKVDKIVVRCSNKIMVVFYCEDIDREDVLYRLSDYVDTIIINDEVIYGDGYITEKLGNLTFKISANSFFQVNTKQTINLYQKVLRYCDLSGNEKVLDLYCGTGTIGLYISDYCKEVLGIDNVSEAIDDANENKKLNNKNNIKFLLGDSKDKISDIYFKPDIVIVDPPRVGLNKSVIESIIELKPSKVIYVSCDPMTLARDLNIFKENYNIVDITPVDMFPQTYHVESVTLLTLNK
ncbi:MAG: 23S rRNA (uracil(1939)-C(5))-methyltransferase RlmD [Ignavibacteriales bacterium]